MNKKGGVERMDSTKTGLAAGSTWGILYAVCAVAFTLAPDFTLAFGNYIFHGILLNAKPLDAANAAIGLVLSVIAGFAIGALYAKVHNYFEKG
ncbi:MAG TPA: DUF5676 family membrane protein [Candidatus Norongarragalinales archaeon]|nr:DUF5676 family membrane protein [Candidatus Norongarragalinales archaeon]